MPDSAKPKRTIIFESGNLKSSEGPYKSIAKANIMKESKIKSLLGNLEAILLTKVVLIV